MLYLQTVDCLFEAFDKISVQQLQRRKVYSGAQIKPIFSVPGINLFQRFISGPHSQLAHHSAFFSNGNKFSRCAVLKTFYPQAGKDLHAHDTSVCRIKLRLVIKKKIILHLCLFKLLFYLAASFHIRDHSVVKETEIVPVLAALHHIHRSIRILEQVLSISGILRINCNSYAGRQTEYKAVQKQRPVENSLQFLRRYFNLIHIVYV